MGDLVLEISTPAPLVTSVLAVFLFLSIVAAIVTWRRPAFGIALLLVFEPFNWTHDIGPTTFTLGKVALLGVLVGLTFRRASLAPLRDERTRAIVGGAVAIVVVTILTAIPATYIDATLRETLKALEYLGVFVAAAIAIRDEADETIVLRALGGLAIVVCALAFAQLWGSASSTSGILIAGRTVARIAGPLEGPNQLAGYLDLIFPLFLAVGLVRRDRFFLVVVIVALVTDVLTLSRGGLLGIIVGAAFVLFARRGARISPRFALVSAAVVAGLAIVATRLGFVGRFFSIGDVARQNGLGTRSELWSAAIALWRKDPGLGIGAGNFELQLPSVGLIGVRTHANSLYLQSLAEGGIALFAAVVWTFVAAIAGALRDANRSAYLLGFGAAASAFAAHQIVDDLTFFPKVGTLWWALLGLAIARISALRIAEAA